MVTTEKIKLLKKISYLSESDCEKVLIFLEALSESQSVSDNETKEKICHADEDGISHNGCVSQPSCDECSAFR